MKMTKVIKHQNLQVSFLVHIGALKPGDQGDLIERAAHHIENLKADSAIQELHGISDFRGFNAFYMGGLLTRVQEEQWYKTLNCTSFTQFIEEILAMSTSTAYDYIGIYRNLVESGVSWKQVEHLGWTKIRLFAKHLTKGNVEGWIKAAESRNAGQLREFVKAEVSDTQASLKSNSYLSTHVDTGEDLQDGKASTQVDTGDAKDMDSGKESSLAAKPKPNLVPKESAEKVTKTWTFKFHPDQEETVGYALERAKEENKTEYNSVAIEYICMEFLETRLGKKKGVKV